MSLISTPQHTKANRHNLKNKPELKVWKAAPWIMSAAATR